MDARRAQWLRSRRLGGTRRRRGRRVCRRRGRIFVSGAFGRLFGGLWRNDDFRRREGRSDRRRLGAVDRVDGRLGARLQNVGDGLLDFDAHPVAPALRLKIRLGEGSADRLLREREIHRVGRAADLLDERRQPLLLFGGDVLALHEIEHEGGLGDLIRRHPLRRHLRGVALVDGGGAAARLEQAIDVTHHALAAAALLGIEIILRAFARRHGLGLIEAPREDDAEHLLDLRLGEAAGLERPERSSDRRALKIWPARTRALLRLLAPRPRIRVAEFLDSASADGSRRRQ